jgi:hypothetical protein
MGSMSERPDPHAADGMVGEHGKPDDHGDGHAHDDPGHGGDGHDGDALGPLDLPAWGAAILGSALGVVVVVALIAAAS